MKKTAVIFFRTHAKTKRFVKEEAKRRNLSTAELMESAIAFIRAAKKMPLLDNKKAV